MPWGITTGEITWQQFPSSYEHMNREANSCIHEVDRGDPRCPWYTELKTTTGISKTPSTISGYIIPSSLRATLRAALSTLPIAWKMRFERLFCLASWMEQPDKIMKAV